MPLPVEPNAPPADSLAGSALDFIEQEIPGIDAISVMLNQRARADGTPYDVMDIGWRIRPSLADDFADAVPGADAVRQSLAVTQTTYYSHPDAHKDWPQIALGEIILKASKVLSIYAGLPTRHDLPDKDYPPGMFGR